jgi:hypothetical protein
MKTKHFSQPTEVVLASGLEHRQIYITNYMSIKMDFSLFQGLLDQKNIATLSTKLNPLMK